MAGPPVEVVIGTGEHERVVIRVLGRMHPAATDYWDGNWLVTPIEVVVGGFTGHAPAALRTDELRRFCEELRRLYETLTGVATLESIEDWLQMTFEGDGAGHVAVTGALRDQPGVGNTLRFAFPLDQTYLPPVLDQLDEVDSFLPVIGKP